MENLQLVLFVLGAIAIIAVLVHGFWSIRKQQPRSLKKNPITNVYQKPSAAEPIGFNVQDTADETKADEQLAMDLPSKNNDVASAEKIRFDPKLRTEFEASEPLRKEPVIAALDIKPEKTFDEQASLFAEELQQEFKAEIQTKSPAESMTEDHHPADETKDNTQEDVQEEMQDVLVIHVCAKAGQVLQGAELLPCLLTLNFKYGDMNIFHRHEDNAGTGKVLFSLANMVKPGIFDPDQMEQFTTHGVVFFMTLPCQGESMMNFSTMLNSAFQLADDLDAVVLDDERQPWQSSTKQAYLDRLSHFQ